jgi:hypothetical protein
METCVLVWRAIPAQTVQRLLCADEFGPTRKGKKKTEALHGVANAEL